MSYKGDIYYIREVLNGNVASFSHLVDKHKDRSFNLALRICGNREDSEEVTQDAFIKAYRSLKGFKMKSSFATWLYRIVYNTAISSVRARKQNLLSLEDFPAEIKDFKVNSSSEEEAEAEYRNSLVNFAMQKINAEERALITLYYFEEMNFDDIAEVTGISKGNIKVKLFRTRQKMSETITKIEQKKILIHEQV